MMKSLQHGMTVIETMGVLAIATALLLGLSTMIEDSLEDVKGQQAALHQAQVVNAASKYISEKYTDLVASTSSGTVATITIAQLKADGLLSNSFSSTNVFNQTPCVLVRQPASGKLDALIATYGGMAIPDRYIPMVAMQAGQGGGYISAAAPGTARGASWELVTTDYRGVACDGTTVLDGTSAKDGGHLVSSLFYDGPAQLTTDFLYRNAVPGRPELNRMNTSLTMTAPIIMTGAALVTAGTACGTQVAFGIDSATRSLLVCGSNSVWEAGSFWKEPVKEHANLPATGNSIGDVVMVTDLNRAFTYNGSGWVALAVDESGNMTIPGTLTVNSVHALGDIDADQKITGMVLNGDWVFGKYWMEAQSMYIKEQIPAGIPCHIPNGDGTVSWAIGTIKADERGFLLTCAWDKTFRYQNGTYTPPY